MILLQESPIEEIRRKKDEIRKKRHQLHVMMSAYCTINCNEDTTPEKDIQQRKDGE